MRNFKCTKHIIFSPILLFGFADFRGCSLRFLARCSSICSSDSTTVGCWNRLKKNYVLFCPGGITIYHEICRGISIVYQYRSLSYSIYVFYFPTGSWKHPFVWFAIHGATSHLQVPRAMLHSCLSNSSGALSAALEDEVKHLAPPQQVGKKRRQKRGVFYCPKKGMLKKVYFEVFLFLSFCIFSKWCHITVIYKFVFFLMDLHPFFWVAHMFMATAAFCKGVTIEGWTSWQWWLPTYKTTSKLVLNHNPTRKNNKMPGGRPWQLKPWNCALERCFDGSIFLFDLTFLWKPESITGVEYYVVKQTLLVFFFFFYEVRMSFQKLMALFVP